MNTKYGIFSDGYLPVMDGVSIAVKNYAYWLNRNAVPTCVITPTFPGYTDKEDFQVIRYFSLPLPMRAPYRMGVPLFDTHISSQILQLQLSLVHAHSPFSSGTMALKLASRNKIPIIATFHSKYRDDFQSIIPNKYLVKHIIKSVVRFYESVDEVWIPQASVADTIREYGYKGKLEVVENGIDIGLTSNINVFRNEAREYFGIKEDILCFLFVGQHIWEKNLKFLLHALKQYDKKPFIAWFVGDGYARNDMENMVSSWNMHGSIKFWGLVNDRDFLKKIYAAADLFLFPSLYDNAPLVIREAAAVQTPSLLLNGSTASEVIENDINGFLGPSDLEGFVKRMDIITSDTKKLKEAGRNASATLCRPWSDILEEVKDRYVAILRRKQEKTYYPV